MNRHSVQRLTVIGIVAVMFGVLPAGAQAMAVGKSAIGSFSLVQNGGSARAVELFGEPSSREAIQVTDADGATVDGEGCVLKWDSVGLRLTYQFSCENQEAPTGALGWGAGMRTSNGIKVGSTVAQVRTKYPRAACALRGTGAKRSGSCVLAKGPGMEPSILVPYFRVVIAKGRVKSFDWPRPF